MEQHIDQQMQQAQRFATFLLDLARPEAPNRAALAALRRGLGKSPGEAAEMFPYVVPWIPERASDWDHTTHFLVASLFALHPLPWADSDTASPRSRHLSRNFGASMAALISKRPDRLDAVERRFVALLNAHQEDIGNHLRRNVALLKAAEIPVDWAQLLSDLLAWDRPQRSVQRRWARSFWRIVNPSSPQQASSAPADNGSDDVG